MIRAHSFIFANCKLLTPISLYLILLCSLGHAQTLLTELTGEGVEFRSGMKVKLPPPTLAGELSDERLAQAKAELAGNDGWEKFSRDSVVAPVTIKLEYVTDSEGSRVGHNVHSAFVVHAKLESLTDKDLMQQIFGKPESKDTSGMKFVDLTDAELKAAGIELPSTNQDGIRSVNYSRVEFTLLEKIRLSGVMRIEHATSSSSKPDSLTSNTICWKLDSRFATDERLKATWLKVGDESSKPQSYSGWGGYLNVTRVSTSPEILVIESRMLLHELPEWFSASNFIRSKLPLAIQEGARNFRRKLK